MYSTAYGGVIVFVRTCLGGGEGCETLKIKNQQYFLYEFVLMKHVIPVRGPLRYE